MAVWKCPHHARAPVDLSQKCVRANTLTTDFCIRAPQEAVNSVWQTGNLQHRQGYQFTSLALTSQLKTHDIQISMNGAGLWRDNVFVRTAVAESEIRGGVSPLRQASDGA